MAAAIPIGQQTLASLAFQHGPTTSDVLGSFQASSLMELLRCPAPSAGQLPDSLSLQMATGGPPNLDGTPSMG